ncbi:ATP-binding protein [Plantactinospora sp. WMMB782]|uniref:ATP-binding protein n=1 Tax=Plantactinospora sp. WMMB782 TaxID=3404121 RepID=UPI003B923FA2
MTGLPTEKVSSREAEVLRLLGARLSNAEIAAELVISVRTVESHVSALLRKTGAADRRALAVLASERQPLAAQAGRTTGPPVPRTSFVGREPEAGAVRSALADARLVTLTGTGGVGKTRLAVQSALASQPEFPAGVAFVDLVPVRDGFVAQAVATALGVAQTSQQPLVEAVLDRLGEGRWLLVLDNCEHLLDGAAGFVERVLTACPGTTVLATSRERLSLTGERVLPVPPLPPADAPKLFRDRALAADPGFLDDPPAVAELCARLDGVPLAIELAAARGVSLGAAGLLTALDDQLRLLAGSRSADERHRSLRTVIGWSYDLLDPAEQALFRRLAVFAGRFDLAAAVAVTGTGGQADVIDLLGRLVDKSLVVHERAARRWRLLAVVRAYAREQLDRHGERAETAERRRGWAADAAAELEERLDGPSRPVQVAGDWRDDFDAVVDDLRAALAETPPVADPLAHRLARSLGHLAYARRFLTDSLDYYRQAAERAPSDVEAARDLRSASDCAHVGTASGIEAAELLLASAERARAGGDRNGEAVTLARLVELANRGCGRIPGQISEQRMRGLLDAAETAGDREQPVVAAALRLAGAWQTAGQRDGPDPSLAEAALAAARVTGDPVLISAGLDAVGAVAALAGRLREAQRIVIERFDLLALMDRNDPRSAPEIEDTFNVAATNAYRVGDLPGARLVVERVAGDELLGRHSYFSTSGRIPVLVLAGEIDEALALAERVWAGWQRAGRPPVGWLAAPIAFTALGHGLRGDKGRFLLWRHRVSEVLSPDGAGALGPAAAGVVDPGGVGGPAPASIVFADARVAVHRNDLADAAGLVERASAEFPGGRFELYARAAGAELAVLADLPDVDERLAAAVDSAAEHDWATACLSRARWRRTGDPAALAAALVGFEKISARFERACTLLLDPERTAEGHAELAALGIPEPGA